MSDITDRIHFHTDGYSRPEHEDYDPIAIMSDAATEIESLRARLEKAEAERDALTKWRELALQFDMHRIEAMSVIRALVELPGATIEGAKDFLRKPPPNGQLALATARNDALEEAAKVAMEHSADAVKQATFAKSATAHDGMMFASDLCEIAADAIRALKS